MTVQQVAQRLNASLATVYLLIEKGDLVAVKIGANGGGVRVLEEDLAVFIESRRTQPPERTSTKKVTLKHLR
jgi:excisionase family DNA binding protein